MRERFSTGITLIETLLVIVIIAAIGMMTVRHFRRYQQETVVAGVKNDVAAIEAGLNQYYYRKGCDRKGEFLLSESAPDLMRDLNLNVTSRPPIIVKAYRGQFGYQARIIDTGRKTTTTPAKSINALEITAALNASLTESQVEWYRQQLNAKAANGHTLVWVMLPRTSLMDSSAGAFKQSQQTLDGPSVSYTASNCMP